MKLSAAHKVLLAPFHNRRWDSDFQTVQRLLKEGSLGRLVSFEARFDRWRPAMPTERLWTEDAATGGVLLNLGPHLADQALVLFGKPEGVSAEVRRERDGQGANDCFTVRLRYAGMTVMLGSNYLSLPAGPRFHLRGTKGNYWKFGLDPQEAALTKITRIEDPACSPHRPRPADGDPEWGREPQAEWGVLHTGIDGVTVTKPVEPLAGDYRVYYTAMRDALLGKGPLPATALDAWRVARLLEWAVESSNARREIVCDWSQEPE